MKIQQGLILWTTLFTLATASFAATPGQSNSKPSDAARQRALELQKRGAALTQECLQKQNDARQAQKKAAVLKDTDALQSAVGRLQSLSQELDRCGRELGELSRQLQATGFYSDWAANMRSSSMAHPGTANSLRQWCVSAQPAIERLRREKEKAGSGNVGKVGTGVTPPLPQPLPPQPLPPPPPAVNKNTGSPGTASSTGKLGAFFIGSRNIVGGGTFTGFMSVEGRTDSSSVQIQVVSNNPSAIPSSTVNVNGIVNISIATRPVSQPQPVVLSASFGGVTIQRHVYVVPNAQYMPSGGGPPAP